MPRELGYIITKIASVLEAIPVVRAAVRPPEASCVFGFVFVSVCAKSLFGTSANIRIMSQHKDFSKSIVAIYNTPKIANAGR
jgi:hypothetical protein